MRYIKKLNEYFDPGVFGDDYGFGSATGVMKINYKPFSDLSVTVGPDPNMERTVKGSEFQIGDVVVSQPVDSKKEVIGVIVRAFRNPENNQFRYFIQVYNKKKLSERVIEIKGDCIKFADGGNHGNVETGNKERASQVPADVFNSKTVFSSSELGLETTGG
jgi:hypothetical protein